MFLRLSLIIICVNILSAFMYLVMLLARLVFTTICALYFFKQKKRGLNNNGFTLEVQSEK